MNTATIQYEAIDDLGKVLGHFSTLTDACIYGDKSKGYVGVFKVGGDNSPVREFFEGKRYQPHTLEQYHFLINGFDFHIDEARVFEFLRCFDQTKRCIAQKGFSGKEVLGSVADVVNYLEMWGA